MNRSTWKSLAAVLVAVLLLVLLLSGGQPGVAGPPSTSSQGTGPSAPAESSEPGANSEASEVQSLSAPGAPLDDRSLFPDAAAAQFYHVTGPALRPTSTALTLFYDGFGCVHATAGASELLQAPLEIPDGSRIVLLRLYFNDTSPTDNIGSWISHYNEDGVGYSDLVYVPSTVSSGYGSNYGNLDHIVDTYSWRYVLNVRLHVASSELQLCGIRVMYHLPSLAFLPSVMRNSKP
jgi:hypothetical protein